MSENMYEKFKNMVDVAGLKKDLATAEASDGDFVEVPVGNYEVKVSKLELGASGERSKVPGSPMGVIWFDIVAGDFKGQKIFMNQMLTTGFGLHRMNEFLSSLESGIPVSFEDFEQYGALIDKIFNEIDGKAEYELEYGKNNKGYSTYTIIQRFGDDN